MALTPEQEAKIGKQCDEMSASIADQDLEVLKQHLKLKIKEVVPEAQNLEVVATIMLGLGVDIDEVTEELVAKIFSNIRQIRDEEQGIKKEEVIAAVVNMMQSS